MPRASHREVEIKLPVPDTKALFPRRRGLKARSQGRVLEQNILFDTRDSDLRHAGILLRLRLEMPAPAVWSPPGSRKCLITSKMPPGTVRPHSEYKERLEREALVRGSQHCTAAFRVLGFTPKFCYEKFRTPFRLAGLHLDLDETPVGTFLELEGSPRAIDRIAKALGYSRRDYVRDTYWELYAADCRRRSLTPKNMVFDKKKIANSALFA
jgi:adenylate cyclase, class 2